MKNILFLTLSKIDNIRERGIYNDLIREITKKEVNVFVVCPRQRRENLPTELVINDDIKILKVKTGNLTSTKSFIEKGISTLMIENQYLTAIKKFFYNVDFDMIMYSTPPITFNKIIEFFKTEQRCITYLLLKDIFPQNAVDIGLMRKGSLLWRYFRNKEINTYNISDVIGCMSKGNATYILKHNSFLNGEKVEIFPNAIKPIDRTKKTKEDDVLKKYNIPSDSTLFVYGGNLGKPQGIDFLITVADNFIKIKKSHLLIVGSGTEYGRIKKYIEKKHYKNVSIYKKMPKEEYDKLISSADVGLIFLDKRFTIPNFPSRLTSYMENSLPILAATDKNTDLKDVLLESNCGFWCESGDLDSFINYANALASNKELRNKMGLNGRIYLENNYDITKTINILLKHLS